MPIIKVIIVRGVRATTAAIERKFNSIIIDWAVTVAATVG